MEAIMIGGVATKTVPIGIVGVTAFGRYPKISSEQTWNMIVSDDWLVDFAGYRSVLTIKSGQAQGRGLFNSAKTGQMIAVIDNGVYVLTKSRDRSSPLAFTKVGNLETFTGDVFIDENDANGANPDGGVQIALCDKKNIYIYDTATSTLTKITTDFVPGYVQFQDGYFIAPAVGTNTWRLSVLNDGTSWPATDPDSGATNVGELLTKPDNTLACVRVPGKAGVLLVIGSIVTEVYTDVGAQLFPYQRSSWLNIDYGCLNPATIAASDQFVIWLGVNEKSGPVILYTDGNQVQQISNDGLNYLFQNLTNPTDCYGFLFKEDGHLIYQFTFPDDNISFIYDFNTQLFFNVSDENQNYHIAKRAVYFDDSFYFISDRTGQIYEYSTKYSDLDGEICPRIRIPKNIRFGSQPFNVNNFNFVMEMGDTSNQQFVDLAFSYNGGRDFGSYMRYHCNELGNARNIIQFWQVGYTNDLVPQLRFYSTGRFVVSNGEMSIQ